MVETEVYANRQLNIVQNKNKRFSKIYSIIDKSARNRLVPDYMEMLSLTYSIYEDMEYFIMIPELIELNKEAESNMQQVSEIGARINQDNIEKLNNLYDKAKEINKKLMKSKNDDDRRVLEQELNELHEKAEAIRFTDEEILIQQEMDYLIRKTKLIISYLDKIPEEYKEMLI